MLVVERLTRMHAAPEALRVSSACSTARRNKRRATRSRGSFIAGCCSYGFESFTGIKNPARGPGFEGVYSSILFFRFDPVLFAFLTCGLNHFFSNQDLIPVLVENGSAQLSVGLRPYHGFLIAAVLQAHGLSPHQVVRFNLATLDDHAMTSLDAFKRPFSPTDDR